MYSRQQGFTLLEILIAVAIFALVASASFMMLQQTIKTGEGFERKSNDLVSLQRAYRFMQNDLTQNISRNIRDQYGDSLPAVMTESMSWGTALELTTAGRRNPLDKARSNLQRVRYFFDGDNLIRRTWKRLDRAPEPEESDRILITNVKSWQLRFLIDNDWVDDLSDDERKMTNLRAIEILIRLENERSFRWLFDLNDPLIEEKSDKKVEPIQDEVLP